MSSQAAPAKRERASSRPTARPNPLLGQVTFWPGLDDHLVLIHGTLRLAEQRAASWPRPRMVEQWWSNDQRLFYEWNTRGDQVLRSVPEDPNLLHWGPLLVEPGELIVGFGDQAYEVTVSAAPRQRFDFVEPGFTQLELHLEDAWSGKQLEAERVWVHTDRKAGHSALSQLVELVPGQAELAFPSGPSTLHVKPSWPYPVVLLDEDFEAGPGFRRRALEPLHTLEVKSRLTSYTLSHLVAEALDSDGRLGRVEGVAGPAPRGVIACSFRRDIDNDRNLLLALRDASRSVQLGFTKPGRYRVGWQVEGEWQGTFGIVEVRTDDLARLPMRVAGWEPE